MAVLVNVKAVCKNRTKSLNFNKYTIPPPYRPPLCYVYLLVC